jgi:hypothetical protein
MDKEIADDLDTISNKAFIAFQYYKEEWADYSEQEMNSFILRDVNKIQEIIDRIKLKLKENTKCALMEK